MSDLLTVEKTLEVLDRLRETVRDFATREARIEHEFATLINRARKQREFDPTIQALRDCLARPDLSRESAVTRQRINETLSRAKAA